MFSLGDVLGNALVRPGHVVVRLILSQHGVQMSFAEDQHAVEELTARGADELLAMASGLSGASSQRTPNSPFQNASCIAHLHDLCLR